jgi:hypothetical protein
VQGGARVEDLLDGFQDDGVVVPEGERPRAGEAVQIAAAVGALDGQPSCPYGHDGQRAGVGAGCGFTQGLPAQDAVVPAAPRVRDAIVPNPMVPEPRVPDPMVPNSAVQNPMGRNAVGRNAVGRNAVGRNAVVRNSVVRNSVVRKSVVRNLVVRGPVVRSLLFGAVRCPGLRPWGRWDGRS